MELLPEAGGVQRPLQRVDPIGHEQCRAFVPLRQEVAHRTIQGARHPDRHALDRDQREGAVDRPDVRGIAAEHAAPPLVERHVVDLIQPGIEQVDDAFHGARHPGIVKPAATNLALQPATQFKSTMMGASPSCRTT